ncbi:uncharacterized protein PFL1_06803 [Pseudozyma flocculosa PF-1]|uniref:TRP C-terminal domain-containing protein n=1 Tax=Pseudozyma flocculosa PF-1 TaxID=1277687 RepID=A0A061H0M2_9BASI|nr:uncharacterized protein PFL1_06803 [Pseudozyma flocculosa PF-1]EPQ25623.1 hypothetical protein PFL1_06803 [Pseudozyma flocculosa PF-1]
MTMKAPTRASRRLMHPTVIRLGALVALCLSILFIPPITAQTLVLTSTTTQLASATGSGLLNTPTKSAGEASRTPTSSAPQVTSTTVPDFDFSGPQVPFLLQKPIPSQDDPQRHRLARPRTLDVFFTGCEGSNDMVDPDARFNVSAVYAQFDYDLNRVNVLAEQNAHSSGVLRITAVGATNAIGRTADSSLSTPPLSTLSVETNFLTFQIFSNNSYLCDHLYPTRPDPENQLIVPAGCLYGPGQVALGLGIPLNDTYTLGTLWTRIRLSDTSSPPKDIACIEVLASPYDGAKWYWDLIFWFPVALAIGYLGVVSLARVISAVNSRAKAFRHKAREGSQPNIVRDTIAPTLVASLSGQQLASSASLLRFVTPGCWDIIMHTQFIAALAMVAVRWPAFAYPFFQRAAWASLIANTAIVGSDSPSERVDPLYSRANLPAGDIGAQMGDPTSKLYMNASQPNVLLNLDGARTGMEAFAQIVGLRPQDLFGTCLAVWLILVAAAVAVSAVVWMIDSTHDTFLRFRKRQEDGAGLTLQLDEPRRSKEVTDADDEAAARSSISRRGGYRFLGRPGRRLFGSSNNSIHLKLLHGNLVRAVILFHLPITIFTTYNMTNSDGFSLTSIALAALSFAFLSVIIPAYLVFRIYRTPTAKLYDSIGTLSALGPLYNTYSPGSQLFCAIDFLHTLVLGIVVGAGQRNGTAQAIIMLVFEVLFALGASLWLPWGDGAVMGPISFVASVLRIITVVLVLLLCPLVDFGRQAAGWLTYVILLIQAILYVCAALILLVKLGEGLVRLLGRAPFDERASARSSGLGGACRDIRLRRNTIQLGRPKRESRQALNRSGSTNTQTLMLANAARPGSLGGLRASGPSSPGQAHASLPSSTSKMPMHSRQTSYASYLDGQLQGRKSPADYLNDSNSPYSTYFRGDPHDDGGIIMAALPPHATMSTANPSHNIVPGPFAGRPSSPPVGPGFVRTGGGRATDASPYKTTSAALAATAAGQHGSIGSMQNPRQPGLSTAAGHVDRRGSPSVPLGHAHADHTSTQIAAQYAMGDRPPAQGPKLGKKPKFWQRRGSGALADSSDEDDDDDAFTGAHRGSSKNQGAWRGLGKMSAAFGALSSAFGASRGADQDPQAAVANEQITDDRSESRGFEVVRPQRPRRSSAAAEQALDSTALAAASAISGAEFTSGHPHRSAADRDFPDGARHGKVPDASKDDVDYDPESGTLPPGAGQQALLLPNRATESRLRSGAPPLQQHPEEGGEDAFWIDSQAGQPNKPLDATVAEARSDRRDFSGASSFRTASTHGRLAQPMTAEVFDSVDDLPEPTSSAGVDEAAAKRVSWLSSLNFDRPAAVWPSAQAPTSSRDKGDMASAPPLHLWDSAQAYGPAGGGGTK